MAIPEQQLRTWSNRGAQETARRTHERIRAALSTHSWPNGMRYDFYLQGSYRNGTNIRGDSDVDVVLELNSAFYLDASLLSEYERNRLSASFPSATHSWDEFRLEVIQALKRGFGDGLVDEGNKAIKVKADPPRLAADVLVCQEYRKYTNYDAYVDGIKFWTLRERHEVVNYPKQHYENGTAKSAATRNRYKPTVRMLKNARNCMESMGRINSDLAPSYFVECLFYNAPDWAFQDTVQHTYSSIVNWTAQTDLSALVCQNRQQYLFGPSPEQWSVANAKTFAKQLVAMWDSWS